MKDDGVGVPYLRVRLPQYNYIIMIRGVYTEIYAWVAARLDEMCAVHGAGGSSPAVRLVLYGHPGTGKSSTLPVLQAALLEQGQPVFYHVLGSENVCLFNDVYSRKMPFTEFVSFRPARPVVCLLDTPTIPYGGQADAMWRKPNTIFVLASSPRVTPDKALEKAQGETYYWTMPAAGLQEIENVDLLRRHVQLTGCVYGTTGSFHLHRYTPSDTCTAGHAFEAKDAYVRMSASKQRVDANNAPPGQRATALPDEEKEEPEGSGSISIGGDSFDVSPGPDWQPQELFELLGPSFRLAFDRTLRKGDDPTASLRNFLKLALINNEKSLKKIVTILQGARLDLREHPTRYHQIVYELPSGPQPSAGDPSLERVIPTRFLLAVVRERVQELQGAMPKAVISKLLPLPHAGGLLHKT
ncbi:hypothetical protein JCM10296v2_000665 [Rhodotorula toruloides]